MATIFDLKKDLPNWSLIILDDGCSILPADLIWDSHRLSRLAPIGGQAFSGEAFTNLPRQKHLSSMSPWPCQ